MYNGHTNVRYTRGGELFFEFVLGYFPTGRRIPVVRLVWDQNDPVRFWAAR